MMPSESTCRNYTWLLAKAETSNIKQIIQHKKALLVIDENQIDNNKFLNVVIGDVGTCN